MAFDNINSSQNSNFAPLLNNPTNIDKTTGAHTFTPTKNGWLIVVVNGGGCIVYTDSTSTKILAAATSQQAGVRQSINIPVLKGHTYSYGVSNAALQEGFLI